MAVGRINGRRHLRGFFYMKTYDRVAGPKKSGRNNEMTRPDYRGGRKVGFHCTMVSYIIYYYHILLCMYGML